MCENKMTFKNLLLWWIHFEVINWSLEEIPRSAITTESDIPGPAPERCGRVHVAQGQRLPQRAPCPPLPAAVYHHRHQVVHAVQVYCITGGVEEPEFQWEDHSVRELGTHTHSDTHARVRAHTHTHADTHARTRARTHTQIHTRTCAHTHMHTHVSARCVCVCGMHTGRVVCGRAGPGRPSSDGRPGALSPSGMTAGQSVGTWH